MEITTWSKESFCTTGEMLVVKWMKNKESKYQPFWICVFDPSRNRYLHDAGKLFKNNRIWMVSIINRFEHRKKNSF